MSCARVVPVVEGHGEVAAVRTLLDRTWREIVGGDWIDVLAPIRRPRSKLLKRASSGSPAQPDTQEVARAVSLAALKLTQQAAPLVPDLILLLIDAEEDCPKHIAGSFMQAAQEAAGQRRVGVVLANKEYETWFVAAAKSLHEHLTIEGEVPEKPEEQGCGKAWIKHHFAHASYSETVDQVRLTAAMDLRMCRERSPSFDKLCRVLEDLADQQTSA